MKNVIQFLYMATETQEDKKELYMLIVAQDSLNAALSTLSILDELDHKQAKDSHISALQESLIISYGRVFTEMKPFWELDDKWSEFEDPNQQACHVDLLNARHKRHAHVDYISSKVVMYPKNSLRISAKKFNERINHVVRYQNYDQRAYPLMKETFDTLFKRLNDRIRGLTIKLYERSNNFNEPDELIKLEDIKALLNEKAYEKFIKNFVQEL